MMSVENVKIDHSTLVEGCCWLEIPNVQQNCVLPHLAAHCEPSRASEKVQLDTFTRTCLEFSIFRRLTFNELWYRALANSPVAYRIGEIKHRHTMPEPSQKQARNVRRS